MSSMPTIQSGDDGRGGKSRFSKVLPLPPNNAPFASAKSPAVSTTSLYSPAPSTPAAAKFSLPPIPKAIPRKALGMTADQKALLAALARATNSPMYSNFPAVPVPPSTTTSDESRSAMGSSSGVDSEAATTPPVDTPPALPPKDTQRQTTRAQQTRTPEPPASPTAIIHALQNTPPQLWKRRSTKSDRSIHFDELKLDRSNGSTSSPPRNEKDLPPKGPLPQLPRSNTQPPTRKPVPAPPVTTVQDQPQPEFMGAKISKLKDKASHSSRSPFPGSSSKDDGRPPTPEYITADDEYSHEEEDEQRGRGARGRGGSGTSKRILDLPPKTKVTSPRSPDTPPEEKDTTQSSSIPQIPLRADSRGALRLLDDLLLENDSSSTLQAPTLSHSRETSETSETITIRSPQPNPPDASHILLASPPSSSHPSPISSQSQTQSQNSPVEKPTTSRKDRQSLSNIHFPTLPSPLQQPPNSILPSLPLSITQLDCYQGHKFMRGQRNTVCPVACMVCERKDLEMRWRCTWCCVSACAGCMQVLSREDVGRDLRVAVGIVMTGGRSGSRMDVNGYGGGYGGDGMVEVDVGA